MTRLEEPQPLSSRGVELSNGPQAAVARRRSYTALALGVGLMLAGVPLAYAMLRGPNPYASEPGPPEGGHHVEAEGANRVVRAAANAGPPRAPQLGAPHDAPPGSAVLPAASVAQPRSAPRPLPTSSYEAPAAKAAPSPAAGTPSDASGDLAPSRSASGSSPNPALPNNGLPSGGSPNPALPNNHASSGSSLNPALPNNGGQSEHAAPSSLPY